MRLPREFEYYIKKGIIRKRSPDKPRAEFLKKEAKVSLEGLKERIKVMKINNKNSNSIIKDCYDILMELVRSRLYLDGYSSNGGYAHEAEVSYAKKLGFVEKEIRFLNELRYLRNSINYYGKILDEEYANKVWKFLNRVLSKIK